MPTLELLKPDYCINKTQGVKLFPYETLFLQNSNKNTTISKIQR